jgi:peptide/nickel transport system substrate-binding protein
MLKAVSLGITLLVIVSFMVACAAPSPTAAPTKPSAPAVATATSAPAPAATTAPVVVATKPAAAAPTAVPVAKVKRGGTMIFSRNNMIDDLDSLTSQTFSPPTDALVYENLFTHDLVDKAKGTFELKPFLAESWEVREPKKVSIKLRRGIKFHDGSDWNADVAKWNIDRMLKDPKSRAKPLADTIGGVDIIDPYTIQLVLKEPSPSLLITLSDGSSISGTKMASKAAFEKHGPEYMHDNPVGTGPMILDSWIRGDRVTLKKRDGYWQNGADGQPLPYLEKFTDRYVQDNAVALMELRSGTLHVAKEINMSDVAAVKANPDLVYDERTWAGGLRFVYAVNEKKPPFSDNLKLRQALHYAVDRDKMASTMTFGLGQSAEYLLWRPGVLGFDETVPNYKYNPTKAKQLLTEAGYPNGIDVPLTTIARDPDRKIAEIVKFMWDAIGIRTQIDSMERAAGLAQYQSGNFIIGHYGTTMYSDPDIFAPKSMTCKATGNWTGYCNQAFDACITQGATILDPAQRHTIYKRCITLWMEDGVINAGYREPLYIVTRKEVKDLTVHWWHTEALRAWLDK